MVNVRNRVWRSVRNRVEDRVGDRGWWIVEDRVRDRVTARVAGSVWDRVWDCVWWRVMDRTHKEGQA